MLLLLLLLLSPMYNRFVDLSKHWLPLCGRHACCIQSAFLFMQVPTTVKQFNFSSQPFKPGWKTCTFTQSMSSMVCK